MIAEPEVRQSRLPVPGVFHASVSRIADYLACPTYYKIRYIDRQAMPVTEAMIAGREFHEWAEARGKGEATGITVGPELEAGYAALQSTLADPTGIEQRFTVNWPDSGQTVEFEARLDWYRLEGDRIRIIDYKSGRGAMWSSPTPAELADDLQAQGYAFAALTEHPWVTTANFLLALPRYGGRLVGATITREQNDQWVEGYLKRTVHRMLADTRFTPNPDCEKCPPGAHVLASDPFRQVTVTVGKVQLIDNGKIVASDRDGFDIELGPIDTPAQAKDAARWSILFRDLAGALERQCKSWADGHGGIQVGTKELGYHYSPKRVFGDPGAAAELCQKLGLPLTPNLTALRPYLEGKKAVPELQALLVETPGTTFGWREAIPLSNASDSTGAAAPLPSAAPRSLPPATPGPSTNDAPAFPLTSDGVGGPTVRPQQADRRARSAETPNPAPTLTSDEAGTSGGSSKPPGTAPTPASPIPAMESATGASAAWSVASVVLRLRQTAARSKARDARRYFPQLLSVYADRWALVKAIFPEATILFELTAKQAQTLFDWSQLTEFEKEAAVIEASL